MTRSRARSCADSARGAGGAQLALAALRSLAGLLAAPRSLAGLLAGLLSLAGLLAACAAAPRPATPDAPLRIGTSLDYHPFSYSSHAGHSRHRVAEPAAGPLDEGLDSIDGFDIAVARAFAAGRGADEPRWVRFAWPALQSDFAAGRFDIAMSGVTVRPERSLAGRFSVPVAVSGAVAIGREGFASDPAHLNRAGAVLAVNAGGHLERVARRRFPAATVVAVADNSLVMRELLEGRALAAITDIHEVASWRGDEQGLAVLGPFTRDYKAYWLQPEHARLARELDAWLLAREADGTLARLRERYFGPGNWAPTATPRAALEAAVAERRALMPLVAEAKRSRGTPVEDLEREAVVLDAGVASVARAAQRSGVAAPDEAVVRAFFQREIDAAKRIQNETLTLPRSPATRVFDLRSELRPALLRIGDKIAVLLVEASRAADLQPTTLSQPLEGSSNEPSRER